MLSIRTNVASLDAQRNLSNTQNALQSSVSHLSAGMRITKAGDDSAGLGISTNLEAQVSSYNQASRNANDGISVAQTAEGALNEVSNILSRLRELTMQASSDGIGSSGLSNIQTEATNLVSELDRIDATAEYNKQTLFNGGTKLNFQVGIRGTSNDSIAVDTTGMSVNSTSLNVNLTTGKLDLSSSTLAAGSLSRIDAAIQTISDDRAKLGAVGNRLQSAINTIQTASTNLSAADSRIRDVDVAEETSKLSRAQVLSQAGVSVLAQANQMPQMALKLLG